MNAPSSKLQRPLDENFIHTLEEAVLIGSVDELDAVLGDVIANDHIPDSLRLGIETLFWYRYHYARESANLSEDAKKQVIRYDSDWAMGLIQSIHALAANDGPKEMQQDKA